MNKRTAEMLCLLCLKEKSTKTNSHFVPAALLKSNIGARDYEEAYTISPSEEQSLDSFKGRNNLNNNNTEKKQNPHSANYILCPSCENELSIWENEMNPIFSKEIFKNTLNQNFQIKKTLNNVDYLECSKVNSDVFVLYFYSIVWRLCIQYKLTQGQDFLVSTEIELLRKIIYDNLPHQKLAKGNIPISRIPFLISTCLSPDINRTSNSVLCHPQYQNPYCFYINDFIILLSFLGSESLRNKIGVTNPISTLIVNNIENSVKIVLFKKEEWLTKQEDISTKIAKAFTQRYINDLSKMTGMSLNECDNLLHSQAKLINEQTGMRYGEAFVEGFRRITAKT